MLRWALRFFLLRVLPGRLLWFMTIADLYFLLRSLRRRIAGSPGAGQRPAPIADRGAAAPRLGRDRRAGSAAHVRLVRAVAGPRASVRTMTWSARKRAWEARRLAPPRSGRRSASRASRRSATPRSTGSTGPWSWQPADGEATAQVARPVAAGRPASTITATRSGPSPAAGTTSTRSATSACPGSRPSPAGIHPTGYRSRLWTMRMFAGFGAAEDTNARFRSLLAAGQTGLSIAYDMPTLYGYDTDDPEAEGEFGTCGVAVSSLADMEVLLAGLPLDRVSTSMTINSPAAPIWAMYIVAAEKAGFPRASLEGTTQNDILKEFVAQKEFLFPIEPSMRLVTDTIEFGTHELPRWNTVSISGYHIREAGSTAIQELAFTIADGMAYVEACLERGLRIDDFAPRLSFFFNSHSDFFEEIAKFRASRRIWFKLMTERYRAESERSTWMRFHTQTAGVSLTPQQPLNNLTRVATRPWPRSSAARSPSTPTPTTRRSPSRPPRRRSSPSASSRSSPRRPGSRTRSTRSAAAGSSRRSRTRRSARSGATSTRSTGGAGWSPRSGRAIPSSRSPTRPIASSASSTRASGGSSGSTPISTTRRPRRSRSSPCRRARSRPSWPGSTGRAGSAMPARSRAPSPACATRRPGPAPPRRT